MSPEEREGRSPGGSTSGDNPEEETGPRTDGHEGSRQRSGEDFARADPDVLLDVPKVQVEELSLEVDDLKARVSLQTRLADLLDIEVGLDVSLSTVKLETKGVEAEAQLKARLENVQAMIERTLASVDANPGLIEDLTNLARGAAQENQEDDQQHVLRGNSGKEVTEAAVKKAEELGMDPYSLEGTGSRGRVIVRDVQRAYRDS
jgi:pyruvate/2-oxoglutarate dehydrogenase complex dihydrolipoamide acyltransferase (E2) component